MKKIVFGILLLALIATISCNSDENSESNDGKVTPFNNSITHINNNITQRSTSTISELANKVFYDDDFTNYTNKYFEFEEKIVTKENYNEIVILKSDDELFNWIENNIEKTSFSSISEFQNMKAECLYLKSIFISKFESDFEFNIKSDVDLQIFTEEIQHVADEASKAQGGGSGCYDSNVRCIRRARNNAATGLAVSAVSAWFNPIVGAAGALATSIYLSNALEACSDAFDSCMGN
ncbi:Hypothetical lipoprotein precursor [Flavobacterium indicum GPTSA100-9 = DSM 17447]|uniref:Hypothetical lipoprotein n=1 Tax=Flavobacterium indicum (strain DSM 17447 / CIP 109464 / GPTSA100-9) TaxID=1094466 RepID=H8XSW9_FLAIG|nr:hypothetical protein [Flavobacterium indicum]CCG53511.1 Hypothetical lipoprotein precursor [Flavobacterium indicum GPTSA100-9 = DSM 17447]